LYVTAATHLRGGNLVKSLKEVWDTVNAYVAIPDGDLISTPEYVKIVGEPFRCQKITAFNILKGVRRTMVRCGLESLFESGQIDVFADVGVFYRTVTISIELNGAVSERLSVKVSFYSCQ
jgi:hypothetical protein